MEEGTKRGRSEEDSRRRLLAITLPLRDRGASLTQRVPIPNLGGISDELCLGTKRNLRGINSEGRRKTGSPLAKFYGPMRRITEIVQAIVAEIREGPIERS